MENNIEHAKYALDAMQTLGADKAQCTLTNSIKHELNVDANKISLLRTTYDTNLNFKAIKDHKQGTISSNKLEAETIRACAKQVLENAEGGDVDEAYDISCKQEHQTFECGLNEADLLKMHKHLSQFLKTCKKRYPHTILENVYLDFTKSDSTLLNSNGVHFDASKGIYHLTLMFTSKKGKNISSFNYTGYSFEQFDQDLIDIGMIDTLLDQSSQQTVLKPVTEKFDGEIIITPDCLGNFLGITTNFLSDAMIISGTSPLKDKLNKSVASQKLTIKDMPISENLANKSFYTHDGFVTANHSIIQNGVLKNFLLSQYGENKTSFKRAPNYGSHLVVDAGQTKLQDLIKSIKKGVLLCRFSGGMPSNNGDFSGVAKNSFYIENGKIKYPINETMISCNILKILKNIDGISKERINFGQSITPWIKTHGVTISGKP